MGNTQEVTVTPEMFQSSISSLGLVHPFLSVFWQGTDLHEYRVIDWVAILSSCEQLRQCVGSLMLRSHEMGDIKLHLEQPKTTSGDIDGSTQEIQCPCEGVTIGSN